MHYLFYINHALTSPACLIFYRLNGPSYSYPLAKPYTYLAQIPAVCFHTKHYITAVVPFFLPQMV